MTDKRATAVHMGSLSGGGGGGVLVHKQVPMLEQEIDEMTQNSVFFCENNSFLCFFENSTFSPLAMPILTTLFFPLRPEKLTLFYKMCIFPTLSTLPRSEKSTLSHRFFFCLTSWPMSYNKTQTGSGYPARYD